MPFDPLEPYDSSPTEGGVESDYANANGENAEPRGSQSGLLAVFCALGVLVLLFTYRRVVARVLQTARGSGAARLKPVQQVARGLKSCLGFARRLAGTWSTLPKIRVSRSDSFEFNHQRSESVSKLTIAVTPPAPEDGEWQHEWDVSPRPSVDTKKDDGGYTEDKDVEAGEKLIARDFHDDEKTKSEEDVSGVFPGNELLPTNPILRSSDDIAYLVSLVPNHLRLDGWHLIYSTSRDGFSLNTLLHKCGKEKASGGPVVTLVKDDLGCVFGSFTSDRWRVDNKVYGDGQSFVFSVCGVHGSERRAAYRWDSKNKNGNYQFQSGCAESIALGGGSHFALWLDNDLLNGTSGACETFGNALPLSAQSEFKVRNVEVWGFESMRRRSVDKRVADRKSVV